MRKKPMLIDKVIDSKSSKAKLMIGLMGTHRGTGVTYTGLMMAFFMGEELRKKTAFLELNDHHDMSLLEKAYYWDDEENSSFSFQNVTIYKDFNENRLAEIYNENYDCFIIDFGTNFIKYKSEFLRCDKKLVLGNRYEWSYYKFTQFIHSVDNIRGSELWVHLIPYANQITVNKLRRDLYRNIYALPFEEDPMLISKATRSLFHQILFKS